MKNTLRLLFVVIVTTTLFACEKDNVPYFDPRDAFIGSYAVTDVCDVATSNYGLTVFKFNDFGDDIVFGFPGLYEAGFEVEAIVTGMKIVIPIQQFVLSTIPEIFYEFSGSGSLNDSILSIDYRVLTIQSGLITDDVECSASLLKN